MATTATIPVKIDQQAAARVVKLGLWDEFEAMLEHTKEVVPKLRSIEVWLDPADGDPTVIISAEIDDPHFSDPGSGETSLEWRWDEWVAKTLPRDVHRNFCMMANPIGDES